MRHLFSVPNRGKEVFVKAPLRHIYSYDISRLEVLLLNILTPSGKPLLLKASHLCVGCEYGLAS